MIKNVNQEDFLITPTATGKWIHAPGNDFLFAFEQDRWPDEAIKILREAYKKAMKLPVKIKEAVKKEVGQDVAEGVYVGDKAAIVKALNSIDGMGQTSWSEENMKGEDSVSTINLKFWSNALAALEGDVSALKDFLKERMSIFQTQLKRSQEAEHFGTIICLVSLAPDIWVPSISIRYVLSTARVRKWVEKVHCHDTQRQKYDFDFTVVDYLYDPEP